MLAHIDRTTYDFRNEADLWRIITVSDKWTGRFDGTNSSNAYRWYYFVNPSQEYRVTVTSSTEESGVYASVNKTDGSHEKLTGGRKGFFDQVVAIEGRKT